jgi:hypothetical protein
MLFKKSTVTAAEAAERGTIWKEDGSIAPKPTAEPTPKPTLEPTPEPAPKGGLSEIPKAAPLRDAKTQRPSYAFMNSAHTDNTERYHPSGPITYDAGDRSDVSSSKHDRSARGTSSLASHRYSSKYSLLGEPVKSVHLSSLIAAGAGGEVSWPMFVKHAVGLQYCAARSEANLDDAFLSWLADRPELLLSLAATTYPVQPTVWENMQRLWQESDLRTEAEQNSDFGGHMVGFSYMQRTTSVDGHF